MTDQTGLNVAGYKPTQSAQNIAAANAIKGMEERFYRTLEALAGAKTADGAGALYNGRDLAIARTHIQEGCSAAVRAIFQPSRLTDEELAKIEGPALKAAVDDETLKAAQ